MCLSDALRTVSSPTGLRSYFRKVTTVTETIRIRVVISDVTLVSCSCRLVLAFGSISRVSQLRSPGKRSKAGKATSGYLHLSQLWGRWQAGMCLGVFYGPALEVALITCDHIPLPGAGQTYSSASSSGLWEWRREKHFLQTPNWNCTIG